jgi:hypothetical protein
LQSLGDANLSPLSDHLLPASRSEFLSSISKAEILSSESHSLGSSCNFPPRCLTQTEVLSSESCVAGSAGSNGNLLACSYSNSIHIDTVGLLSTILGISH